MVANMVMHHVASPPEVLREIRRGLKPAGRFVMADLNEHEAESFWQTLGAQWPGFRRDELTRWLDAAGFVDVRFEAPAPPLDGGLERPGVFLLQATRA
jgi:ArsR family transcriptional regulator